MDRESLFAQLLSSDGEGTCHYCKKRSSRFVKLAHPRRATLDHLVPRSQGGFNTIENMVIACRPCNDRKGSLSEERYRQRLKRLRK